MAENLIESLKKRAAAEPSTAPNAPQTQPLVVHSSRMMSVRAGEIREAVKQFPDHPNSKIFLNAAAGFSDDHELFVESVDLQAILENKEVKTVTDETNVGGDIHPLRRKMLGAEIQKEEPQRPAPAPPPRPAPKPSE